MRSVPITDCEQSVMTEPVGRMREKRACGFHKSREQLRGAAMHTYDDGGGGDNGGGKRPFLSDTQTELQTVESGLF